MDAVLGRERAEQLTTRLTAQTAAAALAAENLSRRFSATAGIRDVSFEVAPGELLALVGASGSGKTTTLRILAGYEQPDSGRVLLGGNDITGLPPQRRAFGMVFQHYALFPHMSVVENVAFGLEARGLGRAERLERARKALDAVGLEGAGPRQVHSLSGGEQQRVALARVLVIEPRALLLDEPLSNLDPALRRQMRTELSATLHRAAVPAVLVTHDQEDAFAIADRVAILSAGRLLQIGSPEEIYDRPANLDVARFIGRGSVLAARGEGATATAGPLRFQLSSPRSGDCYVLVRPEALRVTSEGGACGVVRARRFAGSVSLVSVDLGHDATVEIETTDPPRVGDTICVAPSGAAVPAFEPVTPSRE